MAKDGESLSLAETNRIRAEIGLAPLAGEDDDLDNANGIDDDGADDDDPDARAEANWTEKRQAEAAARSDREARERLAKAKNQRELRAKLQGKGLGAADHQVTGGDAGAAAGETSAAAWVKQSRKRAQEKERELAKRRQREQELDDRDREAVYGEEDLAGLKVAHGAEAFEEGKDVVLTLLDRKVVDDEDDELQNVNLAEHARTAERMDIKKKGKNAYKYTGYDDDEFGDSATAGKARGILSKYDAVIGESSGPRASGEGFRLGSNMPVASTSRLAAAADGTEEQRQLNRDLLTLDYTKGEQNDYLQEGDVGFKVKKKKSKKSAVKSSSRRVAGLDDDEPHANGADVHANGDIEMAADDTEAMPSTSTAERRLHKEATQTQTRDAFDDDELQSALARQRRQVNRKRIQQIRGEDIAQQIADTRAQSMPVDDEEDVKPSVKLEEDAAAAASDEDDGGLVLNDTSEFVRNIALGGASAKRQQGTATPVFTNAASAIRAVNGASKFKKVKAEPTDDGLPVDQLLTEVKREDREEGEAGDDDHDSDDMDADFSNRQSTFGDKGKQRAVAGMDGTDGFGGTAAEKLVSGGLASTLSLLKQSGIVKAATPEELERERATREKEHFIAEARRRDMEREADRAKSKAAGANKTDAQREYENKQRQHEYAQKTLEAFKTYKPKVDIKYTDEFGRDMTPKEAWKDLSHKFHGKGSGTNKRAKLLKKVEDERKREAMASGDTPLAASAAFQARQERMGSATMIIGVGNKNAAPSADQLLGAAAASSSAVQLNKSRKAEPPAPVAKRQKLQPRVLG